MRFLYFIVEAPGSYLISQKINCLLLGTWRAYMNVCLLLVHRNCPVRLLFCRSKAAKYCQRNAHNVRGRVKMEGGENPGFLLTVTHYSNFVARRQTLKAFALGLNLGQPIDKSKRLRSTSSSQKDPGLHNEDLDPAETQQTLPRGQCAVGPGVVGEMGARHTVVRPCVWQRGRQTRPT